MDDEISSAVHPPVFETYNRAELEAARVFLSNEIGWRGKEEGKFADRTWWN